MSKEIAILMKGPLVIKSMRGEKTETRRCAGLDTINENPDQWRVLGASSRDGRYWTWQNKMDGFVLLIKCPYGVIGDVLWVRENGWERPPRTERDMREGADTWEPYYYDGDGFSEGEREKFREDGFIRRPSIHMPRWACRMTLKNLGTYPKRLETITSLEAVKEGVETPVTEGGRILIDLTSKYAVSNYLSDGFLMRPLSDTALGELNRAHFASLWDSINSKRRKGKPDLSWSANPWVWVVRYRLKVFDHGLRSKRG